MFLSSGFLLFAVAAGFCFGLAVFQVQLQSRSFRGETENDSTFRKAVGIGLGGGLLFLIGIIGLGLLYSWVVMPVDEFSLLGFLVKVLIAAGLGSAVGATFYVGLMRDLAVLFLDFNGIAVRITGIVGGAVGAMMAAIDTTPEALWSARLLAILIAGVLGAGLGLPLGARFSLLFTRIFVWGRNDTVVVPVGEAEFQKIFMGQNGRYSMQIHSTMLPGLRYIAAYRLEPASAITHMARIKSIKQAKGEEPDQYTISLRLPASAVGPIQLVPAGNIEPPQRPTYTSRATLQKAGNLDEAFN